MVLKQAENKGIVMIRRKDGRTFSLVRLSMFIPYPEIDEKFRWLLMEL